MTVRESYRIHFGQPTAPEAAAPSHSASGD